MPIPTLSISLLLILVSEEWRAAQGGGTFDTSNDIQSRHFIISSSVFSLLFSLWAPEIGKEAFLCYKHCWYLTKKTPKNKQTRKEKNKPTGKTNHQTSFWAHTGNFCHHASTWLKTTQQKLPLKITYHFLFNLFISFHFVLVEKQQ